ncbi:hypothetical protein L6164_015559 [Bauhinia variegata]|uniref:Uncharacterized protein n=1 Tax=Bauhinia variegata TaxID=167791 RepID=A0ACB9NMA3_BAUVA|nr:hypothetical protein L6164_015559 [Bauhinia variegata]
MLKVDFQCSRECPRAVKKTLEQFNGVESISIDPKRGMVKVVGKVNPMTLVKLLQKTGQRAELWSFIRAPHQAKSTSHTNRNTCDHHRNHNCRRCGHGYHNSFDSSSTDTDDRDCHHCCASKNTKSSLYWQHPKMNGEKSKKKKSWKDCMGLSDNFMEPKVWIKSPCRPRNFPQPPPVSNYNRMMHFYSTTAPAWHARPPMPAAYGYSYSNGSPWYGRSGPSMTHYTSYADNFRYD